MIQKETNKEINIGEVLKFFGIWVLEKQFYFGSRASLWSVTVLSKYVLAQVFGDTVILYHRFDILWKFIRFLDHPDTRPEVMLSEAYW